MARIGIDVTSAMVQGGGIGRYTRELVRAVVGVAPAHEYHLFSAKLVHPPPVPDPIPTAAHTHYHPALLNERWLYRLWYRLRAPLPVQWVTGPLDLFHSPDFVLPPVAGRIPTLLTVHDLSFVHYPEAYTPALLAYLNRVVPWSVGRATHVLADSEATRQDLESLWGVDAAKITVLYSGVSDTFQPVTSVAALTAVRQKYAIGDTGYILAVGTVQPRKNYRRLIEAFAPVAAHYPHQLVIAGGHGWLFEEILAEVKRQKLTDRVRFIGFVDDGDLPALYSGATLLVQPSLYEGFGLPLLEGMACGVPVVTSNTSSLPEVAGEAAVQLSPWDTAGWSETLLALLGDNGRRASLVTAGYHQARTFGWRGAGERLAGVYDGLLGE